MSFISASLPIIKKNLSQYFILAFLFSMLIQIWPAVFTQPLRFVIRIAICNALLLLSAAAIYRYLLGKIASVLLTAALTLNFAISFCTWRIYQSEFSSVFAMSILTTHMSEISSMSGLFTYYFPIIALYFTITMLAIHYLAGNTSTTVKHGGACLLVVFFAWYTSANWLKQRKDLEVYYPLSSRILTNTPFYVASEFIIAVRDNKLAEHIYKHDTQYPAVSVSDTGIENFVVIVGESARRSNMQLYGFGLDTTPVESAFSNNALVFEHAIAPASATVLAVPMILSKADADHFTVNDLADNVIRVANKAGFHTEWISAQGNSGKSNNYVVAIASLSQKAQWVDTSYDEELLPELDKALTVAGRKLIVLHINGSHEMACIRYPASADYYHTDDKYEDCYNNAIRYTDHVIGEVTKRLGNSTSALLYFSDHGLEKNPQLESHYMHGSRNPSKEAYDVPQFIWYSPAALASKPRRLGKVEERYSTANNYELILSLMGISTGIPHCKSPLEPCYQPETSFSVMDGGRHIFEYDDLRSNFSSPDVNSHYRKADKDSL
ncbi:phosphoethanolamine transferase [Scandinavium manionii]|uniref:phosphoethanolamine transferase n=1 Tax=Scandinavium manionii TaxID=2926520 RepID=UPI00135B03AD|nr:sulfatase-like hydrolase/transferase [Scandinavium manionii]MCS2148738.1 phosphoethanolamine transferase [Scandinavium manionii]